MSTAEGGQPIPGLSAINWGGGLTSVGAGHRSAKMCRRSSAPTPVFADWKKTAFSVANVLSTTCSMATHGFGPGFCTS